MVIWLPNDKIMMVDLGSTKNKEVVTEDSFKYFRENTAFKNAGQVLDSGVSAGTQIAVRYVRRL